MSLPRINSEKDMDAIVDLNTAYDVMEQLKIPTDDVCDMSDAMARIKLYFNKSTAQQIYHDQDRVLKDAVNADVTNRQSLRALFSQAHGYLLSLPEPFRADLEQFTPHTLPTLQHTLTQLHKQDCVILVAGEKGAGKSSLVNLLVGKRILPTDMLHGTRTICELRHSESSRRFVLHSWEKRSPPTVVECLHENQTRQFLQNLMSHVTSVDQKTEKSPYEKVEIYWPLPILGEGVVIVDSPGVGESRKVSNQLDEYMARAFGFIYVINISNAGGIHRDRLGQLLRQSTQRSAEQWFDPATALFVCNWWDQVPAAHHDDVLRQTVLKLERVWPGIRPKQVLPLSSVQALQAVDRGHILDEHRNLVQALRRVLPNTFKAKLSTYYRWLSSVLKRSLYSLKISSNYARQQMNKNEATFHNVRNQIEALEGEAETKMNNMRDQFKRKVDEVTRNIVTHMKSEKFQGEMSRWSSGDCPAERDLKKAARDAAARFQEKLATTLDVWEINAKVVDGVKALIRKTFKRDLELFEDQIKKVEGVLFQGMDNGIITDLHSSMRHHMTPKNVWKKAGAKKDKFGGGGEGGGHGCFSLGSAVSGCRQVDTKSTAVKSVLKAGLNPHVMAALSTIFLSQIKDEDVAAAVKKFFDRIAKRFDDASKLLPEFLKADRNLLKTLAGDVKGEQQRLAKLYPSFMKTCAELQGSLDMFYVQQLVVFDYNMKDLKYNAGQCLGRGSFADVFSSEVRDADGERVTVALKIQREKLDAKNVTDVLLEDRTLRDLRHKNIIRYYGSAEERAGGDLRWVMVLEFCTRTISKRFLSPEANVPGRQQIASLQTDAMRDVALFAGQICAALCYLHNKGIVHRDLKPENILLTQDDVVKLTDVGLAKSAADIAGTLAGTPVYMAPEVLLQQGQYDTKADVYSLAIILWELWYGQDAADHISSHLFRALSDAVKEGLRPSLSQTNKPPPDWVDLLQSAWDLKPQNRPPAQRVADFFQDFLEKNQS